MSACLYLVIGQESTWHQGEAQQSWAKPCPALRWPQEGVCCPGQTLSCLLGEMGQVQSSSQGQEPNRAASAAPAERSLPEQRGWGAGFRLPICPCRSARSGGFVSCTSVFSMRLGDLRAHMDCLLASAGLSHFPGARPGSRRASAPPAPTLHFSSQLLWLQEAVDQDRKQLFIYSSGFWGLLPSLPPAEAPPSVEGDPGPSALLRPLPCLHLEDAGPVASMPRELPRGGTGWSHEGSLHGDGWGFEGWVET